MVKFADNTKLLAKVGTKEDREQLKWDLVDQFVPDMLTKTWVSRS